MGSSLDRLVRLARPLLVAGAALLVIGCAGKNKGLAPELAPAVVKPLGTIGAGDELEVRFYYAPELNTQQRVRPDGKISLQLVGDVDAAGLTPATLDSDIEQLYADKLRFPEVSVIVRGQYGQRVIVGGEVTRPGAVEMPSSMNLLEAVMLAGGFNLNLAELKTVMVLRNSGEGKTVGYAVDVRDALAGAPSTPFMLQPGDIVYVPRTQIADVNLFVEQYVNGLLPNNGVIYSREVGDGNIAIGASR